MCNLYNMTDFKKVSQANWRDYGELQSGTDRAVVADEARIGQKNKITRRWRNGHGPSAPQDQRTASA